MEFISSLTTKGLKCYNSPGLGKKTSDLFHVSGAIIIPPNTATVMTCGTTGYDENLKLPKDILEETENVFKNIESNLAAAGVKDGFQSVFQMTSYHTGPLEGESMDALDKCTAKYFRGNRPAWAGVGVTALADGARIELQVQAILKLD